MNRRTSSICAVWCAFVLCACKASAPKPKARPKPDAGADAGSFEFRCERPGQTACLEGTYYRCVEQGEFLIADTTSCEAQGLTCAEERGCVVCVPDSRSCEGNDVRRCVADGSGYEIAEICDVERGEGCREGSCQNLCAVAERESSYEGCAFYAVDLDNAVVGIGLDAAAQQYAVIVSNPNAVPVHVTIEQNDAAPGEPERARVLAEATIVADDLEVFELPQREVDGSSLGGHNDGTGTALTSHAYRIRSTFPVIAYQLNPLNNVDVFSNDASLLLPVSSLATRYTALGWPQTIADDPDPTRDFDPSRNDEDERAFLTVVGTEPDTHVRIKLGDAVVSVLGSGDLPAAKAGDELAVTLGAFDTLNLETKGFLADFSGTVVEADARVAVFVGNEASDVPFVMDRRLRSCCADHLEEQLIPDRSLGQSFAIVRMPARTRALNRASQSGPLVAEIEEPEWVRIMAVQEGTTNVLTTLPGAQSSFALTRGQVSTIRVTQDFLLATDQPVSVLQAQPSQDETGIGRIGQMSLPGGDPALVLVPPIEQFRSDYVFLTPAGFAFDFVTIVARAEADVRLDEEPVSERCDRSDVGTGTDAFGAQLSGLSLVAYRCPLSSPIVRIDPMLDTSGGAQPDGVHRIRASAPVGIIVYGFDAFVSYAYPGGLNLRTLY